MFIRKTDAAVSRIYTDSQGIPTLGAGYALAAVRNGRLFLLPRSEIEAAISAGLARHSQFSTPFTFTTAEWDLLVRTVGYAD